MIDRLIDRLQTFTAEVALRWQGLASLLKKDKFQLFKILILPPKLWAFETHRFAGALNGVAVERLAAGALGNHQLLALGGAGAVRPAGDRSIDRSINQSIDQINPPPAWLRLLARGILVLR